MFVPFILLAAGRSTRFGTLKQVAPVGPDGASILAYTVADALTVGFSEVVVVVRPEIESTIREHLDRHLGARLPIRFVHQPHPLGTGHAALLSLHRIDGPAGLANGDDAYGRDGLSHLLHAAERCASPEASGAIQCALVAYPIAGTLSDHGGVSRGWVQASGETVTSIEEVYRVQSTPVALVGETASGESRSLPLDALGSMNLWMLGAGIAPLLAQELERYRRSPSGGEFALPTVLGHLLETGEVSIRLAGQADGWFGLTFAADLAAAQSRTAEAHCDGLYSAPLASMLDPFRLG